MQHTQILNQDNIVYYQQQNTRLQTFIYETSMLLHDNIMILDKNNDIYNILLTTAQQQQNDIYKLAAMLVLHRNNMYGIQFNNDTINELISYLQEINTFTLNYMINAFKTITMQIDNKKNTTLCQIVENNYLSNINEINTLEPIINNVNDDELSDYSLSLINLEQINLEIEAIFNIPNISTLFDITKLIPVRLFTDLDVACVICLDNMQQGDIVTYLPCLHVNHTNCINEWFTEHSRCPHCNYNVASYLSC